MLPCSLLNKYINDSKSLRVLLLVDYHHLLATLSFHEHLISKNHSLLLVISFSDTLLNDSGRFTLDTLGISLF